MSIGQCHWCGETRKLAKSHAIPRSFIKDMLRLDSGKMMLLSSGPEATRSVGDPSTDYLLCFGPSGCDHAFGRKYDYPLASTFAAIRREAACDKPSHILSDGIEIKNALASVIWRAGISGAELYSGFTLPYRDLNRLRSDITGKGRLNFSYRLRPLGADYGFSKEVIDAFFASPKRWRVQIRRKNKPTKTGLFVIFGGIAVEIVEANSPTYDRQNGYLLNGKTRVATRSIPLSQCPGIDELLEHSVSKEKLGETDYSASSS